MAAKNGLLLSLEGIDFTWKTPFSEWLLKDCSEKMPEVIITRDPPYRLKPWDGYKEFFEKNKEVSYLAEAIMLLAARLDNFERWIQPALLRCALIISDRYIDSWLAYQGVRLAHYFNKNSEEALNFLLKLHQEMIKRNFLRMPDLTILISDNPAKTIQRKNNEKETSKYEELDIQQRVQEQYKILARLFPERIVVIDVEDKSIQESYKIVKTVVLAWLDGLEKGYRVLPSAQTIKSGQRVMALRTLSWTLGRFDDYPLVINSGDEGTIKNLEGSQVLIEWDKDEFKSMAKALNIKSEERFSYIILP